MHVDEKKLEQFVVSSRLGTKADFEAAQGEAHEKNISLSDALLSRGIVSKDDLRRAESFILGLSFVDLKHERLDFETLSLIPEPVSRALNVVSFRKDEKHVEVALLDIKQVPSLDFLRIKTGLKITPRLTDEESMKAALFAYQKHLKSVFGETIQRESSALKGEPQEESEALLHTLSKDKRSSALVDALIRQALLQETREMHLTLQDDELVIRYRLNGSLREAMMLPYVAFLGIKARLKLLAGLSFTQELPQEGRFKLTFEGEKVSCRLATTPSVRGEKLVLTFFPENVSGFSLDALGFKGEALEDLYRAMSFKGGMILVAGPKGAGKTTVLYTLLDLLNSPHVNVGSIEESIELQIGRVHQIQVRPDIGLDTAGGLRALIRDESDVIMVSSLKDEETLSVATAASLSGRLVLSALEARSGGEVVAKLLELKGDSHLLASSLNTIVSVRVAKRLSENKVKYFLTPDELKVLENEVSLERMLDLLRREGIIDAKTGWDKVPFWTEVAPSHPVSLIGLQEVLKMTPHVRELIAHKATREQVEEAAKVSGMISLIEDGILKAAQGLISIEEVFRAASK